MLQTFARRYFYKLIANFVSVPVYLLMEAILPRALGPSLYGSYNFTTALFQQFTGFLDMGTSTCFYNLLSRYQKRTSLIAFYLRINFVVFTFVILAVAFLFLPGAGKFFMPGIPLYFAPLAAIWAYLTWLGRVARSVNDALGVTVPSELWRAVLSSLAVLILLGIFLAHKLTITTLFLQQYALLAASCLAWWHVAKNSLTRSGLKIKWKIQPHRFKTYEARFFNYCHPLFVQAILSFFMLASERWLLQWFDGSAEQGFFALSQKVGMACLLFVSAMTPLLMRELSIAWGKRDLTGMANLLRRFAPLLYSLAAYFSCFVLVEGSVVVKWFGGAEFASALLPVQIMALYPVHQSYGQIASSIFHVAGKTKILRNMTACECVYGLLTAWILIAPEKYLGFNLGATGLAIKTVAVQFVSVNIYLWLAARFINFPFFKNLFHQVMIILLFMALAFTSRKFGLLIIAEQSFWRFIVSGLIYSGLCALFCGMFPILLGFSRQEFKEIIIRFLRKPV